MDEAHYDKYANFYYTNLINSIILFSLTVNELKKIEGPGFDPIFELETEIDYAYIDVCFETIFRNNLIDTAFKNDLLKFKKEVDAIPKEIWEWKFIDNDKIWITVKQNADRLLNNLGISSRIYNDDFTTIFNEKGDIVKKAKKL